MANRTEPINVVTSLVFIFASLILFGFVLALIFYFQYAQDQLAASTAIASSPETLRVVRANEEEYLTKYEYVNKEKGTVRIPIERAMALEAIRPWRLSQPKATPADDATSNSTPGNASTPE